MRTYSGDILTFNLKKKIELEKHSHYIIGFGFILCYI